MTWTVPAFISAAAALLTIIGLYISYRQESSRLRLELIKLRAGTIREIGAATAELVEDTRQVVANWGRH